MGSKLSLHRSAPLLSHAFEGKPKPSGLKLGFDKIFDTYDPFVLPKFRRSSADNLLEFIVVLVAGSWEENGLICFEAVRVDLPRVDATKRQRNRLRVIIFLSSEY